LHSAGRCASILAAVGEALIDLVIGGDGRVDARPGSGPGNTARTLSRLGAPAMFLGGLAADTFGRRRPSRRLHFASEMTVLSHFASEMPTSLSVLTAFVQPLSMRSARSCRNQREVARPARPSRPGTSAASPS
jgi:hypothetical protein